MKPRRTRSYRPCPKQVGTNPRAAVRPTRALYSRGSCVATAQVSLPLASRAVPGSSHGRSGPRGRNTTAQLPAARAAVAAMSIVEALRDLYHRFQASAPDLDAADPSSAQVTLGPSLHFAAAVPDSPGCRKPPRRSCAQDAAERILFNVATAAAAATELRGHLLAVLAHTGARRRRKQRLVTVPAPLAATSRCRMPIWQLAFPRRADPAIAPAAQRLRVCVAAPAPRGTLTTAHRFHRCRIAHLSSRAALRDRRAPARRSGTSAALVPQHCPPRARPSPQSAGASGALFPTSRTNGSPRRSPRCCAQLPTRLPRRCAWRP